MGSTTALVLIAILAVFGTVVVVGSADVHLPGNQMGYQPDQPVLFSHQLHAGDLKITCLYCHSGAERSRAAGIPPAGLCLNCHKFVSASLANVRQAEKEEAARAAMEGREPQPVVVVSEEIRKVYRALGLDDAGQPVAGAGHQAIRWVRVHNLPDHAFFDHRAHVTAGVACQTCHGPVEGLHRIRQSASLVMGWCLDCHRRSRAAGVLPDGRPSQASTDCGVCHH